MTNDINLDEIRYIELLKKQEILRNQGTSFFIENREKEDCELSSYNIILENQIYYNQKVEYISLVEEYLRESAGKDGAALFRWEFFTLFRKDNKALEILKKEIIQEGLQRLANFSIDPKSTEFSALINQIVGDCEFLTLDPEDSYGMTLDQFRNSTEKIFFKIKKYSDE
jgi:hypothetical protein